MSKPVIMLVCSAGMSTSMLVQRMEQAAADKGIEAEIFAVSASEADEKLSDKDVSVLMLGPQVRFMLKQFEEKVKDANIPVEVINMSDYGVMNGEKVLSRAFELIG